MAGNQEVFDQAMMRGDTAAWDQEWQAAIEAYMQALREFPTTTITYNSLGYALFQAGRLEDALKVYLQAHKLDSNDPLPVEKSADVLERMGRVNDAAKQYLVVAEIYLGQHDLEKAIANWERATRITPGMIGIHKKLAMAYERTGQREQAINEYLKLAFNFQSGGKADIAMQALQRAIRINPKEPRVLNAITAVRASRPIAPELLESPQSPTPKADTPDTHDPDPNIGLSDERGPMGEAVMQALESLATEVFESGNMGMAEANAMQAIELHRAEIQADALEAYRRAEGDGMNSPALMLNIGILLVEAKQWDAALPYLETILNDSTFGAGAKHAMSLVQIGKQHWMDAAKYLIQTLRSVDLSLSLDEDEAADLNNLYQRINSMIEKTDAQTLENLSRRLADMLTGADWKQRVAQTRSRLEELVGSDNEHVLEDIAQGDEVIDAMSRIDLFMQNRKFIIAMDEAHRVLEKEPGYLAAHLRVAQIAMELGRLDQAVQKYNVIARTYLLRGDQHKAADILNEVIKIAPADIDLRNNLIELLESQGRYEEMVAQYLDLGETYATLADFTSARQSYDQALKLAQRHQLSQDMLVSIMHKIGDADYERLDLRGALRNYQKLVELVSNDEKAYKRLVNINYRIGNTAQGLKDLDKLLRLWVGQKKYKAVLALLEEQSETYPTDMGLRSRLGSVYKQMREREKALEQFEVLRQLQTEAGMHNEARQTIRTILSLNPDKAEDYQRILQQMGG